MLQILRVCPSPLIHFHIPAGGILPAHPLPQVCCDKFRIAWHARPFVICFFCLLHLLLGLGPFPLTVVQLHGATLSLLSIPWAVLLYCCSLPRPPTANFPSRGSPYVPLMAPQIFPSQHPTHR